MNREQLRKARKKSHKTPASMRKMEVNRRVAERRAIKKLGLKDSE